MVKQIVGGEDAEKRFARELAALRLAAAADPAVAPQLLGVDPAGRVLVLEHLTADPDAADWAVGYARALAGLHATGSGSGILARSDLGRWTGPTATDITAFLRLAAALGAEAPAGTAEQLAGAVERMAGWPHDALLHGDPCPDNEVQTDAGVRFIDFERAALGPGLVELAYLRMAFPTCWCAALLPVSQLRAAEAAYGKVWATLTGRQPVGSPAEACLGWLLRGDALVEMALRDGTDHLAAAVEADWNWGPVTARQRLNHRLAVVAGLTTGAPDLTAVHALTTAMCDQVRMRWPGLPPLPPFLP